MPRLPYIARRKPGRTFSRLIAGCTNSAYLQQYGSDAQPHLQAIYIQSLGGDVFTNDAKV